MNLIQINYFLSVVRTKSFSKSAEELFVSSPAISKQIAKLEEELNTTLLNRSSQGTRLTSEGEIYFEFFSRTSAELLDIQRKFADKLTEPTTFRLGVLDSWQLSENLVKLNKLLLVNKIPVKIKIYPMSAGYLKQDIENGKLDAALCTANGIVNRVEENNLVNSSSLGVVQKAIIYSPETFPNDNDTEKIDVNSFRDKTLLTVSNQYKNLAVEENLLLCNQLGFHPQNISYDKLSQVMSAVLIGDGFTILDEWSMYFHNDYLEYILLNSFHEVKLFWSPHNNNPFFTTIIDALTDIIASN